MNNKELFDLYFEFIDIMNSDKTKSRTKDRKMLEALKKSGMKFEKASTTKNDIWLRIYLHFKNIHGIMKVIEIGFGNEYIAEKTKITLERLDKFEKGEVFLSKDELTNIMNAMSFTENKITEQLDQMFFSIEEVMFNK